MALADLDYARVTGRFAITVGDTADPGDEPDIIWCDEGTVTIEPLQTFTKVAGAAEGPFTAGHSIITATIQPGGHLTYLGKQYVYVVDLTSDKVNPQIGANRATHRVRFQNVKADGTAVTMPEVTVRLTKDGPNGDGINDLTVLAPVVPGVSQPIYRGEQGVGVVGAAIVGGGELELELTDGETVNAGQLPVGPGGSDAGVAGYLADEDSESRASLDEASADLLGDPTTALGARALATIGARIEVGRQFLNANDNTVANIAADDPGNGTGTDDSDAWDAIMNSITASGVTITFDGRTRHSRQISWKTKTSLRGFGIGRSVLLPTGAAQSAIQRGGSLANPLVDCAFENFEVDGSFMPGPTGKAFFITYMLRPIWRDLYIHHTASTGLGSDFLRDYLIDNVIAENCGRLGAITDLGCAGIGIGTGAYQEEAGTVRNSVTRNNKRAGVFWEKQSIMVGGTDTTPYFSRGAKLIGHTSEGNLFGIGDQGMEGLEILGGRSFGNVNDGLYIAASNAGALGFATRAADLELYSNGRHGLHLDWSALGNATPAVLGRYHLDVYSHDNTGVGAKFTGSAQLLDLYLRLRAARNTSIGLDFAGGTYIRPDIEADVRDSGSSGTNQPGIRVLASINGGRMKFRSGDTRTSGRTQTHGADLQSSVTLTDFAIEESDGFNNITAAMSLSSTLAGRTRVGRVAGYNVRTGAPTAGSGVKAPLGTEYVATDGAAGAIRWVKTGAGDTAWTAIA